MAGIGLITNPRSRVNKRDPGQARRLGYLLGSRGAGSLVDVGDHHVGPFGVQPSRGGQPDSATAAGHHGDLAAQPLRQVDGHQFTCPFA